jgi:uncharacterized phage protein gp47/JayE
LAELGDFLEQYTFDYLLRTALDRVPNDIDKRQGSIIYDAIAPACYSLAEAFITMRQIYKDTFAGTATGELLEMRAAERGVLRQAATKAIRKGTFKDAAGLPVNIVLGSRFSTLGEKAYTYSVFEEISTGGYLLECEQAGEGGNTYVGDLLPISFIQPLAEAKLLDIIIPGEDEETDDGLRVRYLSEIGSQAFAGNITAYDKMLKEISGVGEVQVYPVWAGGGTVKLSVVDSTFAPVNSTFLTMLQDMIDPPPTGTGLGLAPIGHQVTITAPEAVPIDITAKVTLQGGATLPAAQIEAEAEIRDYIESVAKTWGIPDSLNNYSANIYTAQITSAILRSPSIANTTNVKTNNTPLDLTLTQSPSVQQIPVMGTVVLDVQ